MYTCCNHIWIWKRLGYGYSESIDVVCEKCGEKKYKHLLSLPKKH